MKASNNFKTLFTQSSVQNYKKSVEKILVQLNESGRGRLEEKQVKGCKTFGNQVYRKGILVTHKPYCVLAETVSAVQVFIECLSKDT